ncbi:MAG TPA: PilN domain-containing protein [Synechococcales cyanobacterium M55_K2018_004]|nr:PilN domain-containing protein [Synechococcales cyanobacterium M55_K2018_004]
MYALDINFLNDRTERLEPDGRGTGGRIDPADRKPLYVGAAIGLLFPALVGVAWLVLSNSNAQMAQRQQELDAQLATLQAALQEVEGVKGQVAQIEQENQALATVFDRIKPWSAILQDIRSRVPAGIQIASITQSPPEPAAAPTAPAAEGDQQQAAAEVPPPVSRIEITGNARSFNDVNDLVLVLQQSPFLSAQATRLVSAQLVANPTPVKFEGQQEDSPDVEVQLPDVVQFTVTSTLTDRPASELLQDLRDTLAVGLPARIDALRDLGVKQ